jgi:hypothetical protein
MEILKKGEPWHAEFPSALRTMYRASALGGATWERAASYFSMPHTPTVVKTSAAKRLLASLLH